jgi:hypothetical protein
MLAHRGMVKIIMFLRKREDIVLRRMHRGGGHGREKGMRHVELRGTSWGWRQCQERDLEGAKEDDEEEGG